MYDPSTCGYMYIYMNTWVRLMIFYGITYMTTIANGGADATIMAKTWPM